MELSDDELINIIHAATCKSDLARKLGFTYFNGKVWKSIQQIIDRLQVSTQHFDATATRRSQRTHDRTTKSCPICFNSFSTLSKNRKITCSYSCANRFFKKRVSTISSRLKKSHTLLKLHGSTKRTTILNGEVQYTLNCQVCNKEFFSGKSITKTCSPDCLCYLKNNPSPLTRQKISQAIKKRVALGIHPGWATRNKLIPSYPEKYVASILDELNVNYIRELKVNKWFIDFTIPDSKIALEVDGKQHNLPERKKSDFNKDTYLSQVGWQVHRIPWTGIRNLEDREKLLNQIKSLIPLNTGN
jgi:very-short-patch-repair endonuclease